MLHGLCWGKLVMALQDATGSSQLLRPTQLLRRYNQMKAVQSGQDSDHGKASDFEVLNLLCPTCTRQGRLISHSTVKLKPTCFSTR